MARSFGRREFMSVVGAAAAWPIAARAQRPARLPTIGFLGASTPSAMSDWAAAFVRRLHDLGWIEGRNVSIEYRWAEGSTERYAEIADEFVRLRVDVIVTYGTAAVAAAKRATTTIPIIFAGVGDPVGAGLVASLARPGGNVTGLSLQQIDSAPKRLELLRKVVPTFRRLAIIANVDSRSAVLDMEEIRDMAGTLGLQASKIEIRRVEEIAPAIEAIKGRADALYVVTDPLLFSNRIKINTLTMDMRLPTMCGYREYVEAGCFMSYGPSYLDLFRRAGEHVSKILHGAKSEEIPVEQPIKFELVINLKTAKALGLEMPPTVLALTDAVIE